MSDSAKRPTAQAQLETPDGLLVYTLTRKKIRNINLRVGADGSVRVSAPLFVSHRRIEEFLRGKSPWIHKTRQEMRARPPVLPCSFTQEECLALFSTVSDRFFPLFADILKGAKPELRVREMTSRWGVCHPSKRRITLNTRLAEKPLPAVEYVILHEYVHFLHPNHQQDFHAAMARLMPDYKQRRKLLR